MSTDHYIKIQRYLNSLLIDLSSITVLIDTFVVSILDFLIELEIMSFVFLQTLMRKNDYDFTSLQNATCKQSLLFTHCQLFNSCR